MKVAMGMISFDVMGDDIIMDGVFMVVLDWKRTSSILEVGLAFGLVWGATYIVRTGSVAAGQKNSLLSRRMIFDCVVLNDGRRRRR